jgi:DNA-binding transcriptional LysR family regulator
VNGHVRINAPFSFGIRKLAPLWGIFHQKYPKVTLEVVLSDRLVDVVEEGYDIAIRIELFQTQQ